MTPICKNYSSSDSSASYDEIFFHISSDHQLSLRMPCDWFQSLQKPTHPQHEPSQYRTDELGPPFEMFRSFEVSPFNLMENYNQAAA